MDYNIRKATIGDLPEIIKLCAEHAEFEKAAYTSEGKAEKLTAFLFADNPRLFCLLVESEQKILGYITYMKEFSTWDADFYIHMDCLYLRPEARNFGIGEQLIKEMAKQSLLLGCRQVQWQTPTFNEKAMKFYERIGATAKPKTRFFLDERTLQKLSK
ncbi:MAG: GNAT family N-acetyltransferase [Chitinophagaceae bacterium]|nr:GNAT family N-acetyltransferase [Chitinophagaceae bacterium]